MDVVTDACPIGGGILISEDTQLFSFSDDDLLDEGEEVVGVLKGLIPQQIGLMRTTGVEIPERNNPPVFMDAAEGGKQHFDTGLGLSIGTTWQFEISLSAVVLIAIHTGRGRKDEALAVGVFLHQFEKIH